MRLATDEAVVIARIARWASADDRVRAALLTSSRAVLNAPVALLSDYDSLWPCALTERIIARGTLPAEFDGGFRVLLDKGDLTRDWPPPSHTARRSRSSAGW